MSRNLVTVLDSCDLYNFRIFYFLEFWFAEHFSNRRETYFGRNVVSIFYTVIRSIIYRCVRYHHVFVKYKHFGTRNVRCYSDSVTSASYHYSMNNHVASMWYCAWYIYISFYILTIILTFMLTYLDISRKNDFILYLHLPIIVQNSNRYL